MLVDSMCISVRHGQGTVEPGPTTFAFWTPTLHARHEFEAARRGTAAEQRIGWDLTASQTAYVKARSADSEPGQR
jgi:hypothetical protein